jgi:5-methylthioadenosine/S-adenosylhomocysteine deaminase
MAEALDLQFHIHLHETAEEVQQSLTQYQLRPMARLDKLGVLTARTMAVHATQLTAAEIAQLAEKSVNVIHCPESNLKLASGFCPITQLHQAGVNVALGTDGAASNDDLDILGEMRTAALLAKGVSQDAKSIPANVALQMATLNGARALGIAQITGSLEVGKAADIVAIDMQQIETQPIYDLLSHLVYAVSRERVTDVWVAGKQLLKSRALTSLDIRDIATKTVFWREKILNSISN